MGMHVFEARGDAKGTLVLFHTTCVERRKVRFAFPTDANVNVPARQETGKAAQAAHNSSSPCALHKCTRSAMLTRFIDTYLALSRRSPTMITANPGPMPCFDRIRSTSRLTCQFRLKWTKCVRHKVRHTLTVQGTQVREKKKNVLLGI